MDSNSQETGETQQLPQEQVKNSNTETESKKVESIAKEKQDDNPEEKKKSDDEQKIQLKQMNQQVKSMRMFENEPFSIKVESWSDASEKMIAGYLVQSYILLRDRYNLQKSITLYGIGIIRHLIIYLGSGINICAVISQLLSYKLKGIKTSSEVGIAPDKNISDISSLGNEMIKMRIWIEDDDQNIKEMEQNYENPFDLVLQYGIYLKGWHKQFVKNPKENEKFKQKGYHLQRAKEKLENAQQQINSNQQKKNEKQKEIKKDKQKEIQQDKQNTQQLQYISSEEERQKKKEKRKDKKKKKNQKYNETQGFDNLYGGFSLNLKGDQGLNNFEVLSHSYKQEKKSNNFREQAGGRNEEKQQQKIRQEKQLSNYQQFASQIQKLQPEENINYYENHPSRNQDIQKKTYDVLKGKQSEEVPNRKDRQKQEKQYEKEERFQQQEKQAERGDSDSSSNSDQQFERAKRGGKKVRGQRHNLNVNDRDDIDKPNREGSQKKAK